MAFLSEDINVVLLDLDGTLVGEGEEVKRNSQNIPLAFEGVSEFLKQQRHKGRDLVLATLSTTDVAERVLQDNNFSGLFRGVFGSDILVSRRIINIRSQEGQNETKTVEQRYYFRLGCNEKGEEVPLEITRKMAFDHFDPDDGLTYVPTEDFDSRRRLGILTNLRKLRENSSKDGANFDDKDLRIALYLIAQKKLDNLLLDAEDNGATLEDVYRQIRSVFVGNVPDILFSDSHPLTPMVIVNPNGGWLTRQCVPNMVDCLFAQPNLNTWQVFDNMFAQAQAVNPYVVKFSSGHEKLFPVSLWDPKMLELHGQRYYLARTWAHGQIAPSGCKEVRIVVPFAEGLEYRPIKY